MSAPLLQVEDLTLKQGGQSLIDKLSFSIHSGECWALLGRNGAGKTSLLHTLAGVRAAPLNAHQGQIELLGQSLTHWPPRQRARHVGLLTQDPSEGFEARVFEAAQSGRHPYIERWSDGAADDEGIVQHALATCGLNGFEARRINSLSGGERRRLGIATLLAQNPPLMLLDEPLNHLDLPWQWCILRQLRALTEHSHGLLMSLHDPNMARQGCTHALLILNHGTWLAGRVEDVLTRTHLETLYGLKLRQLEDDRGAWFVPDMHAAHAPL
ncbi:MAG: ABC transporter ATP-binding protein [Halothiobacillaceae bacterium]|nr:ABC transporter ATP-binding protein [Halothiobacillaceae bacterium]